MDKKAGKKAARIAADLTRLRQKHGGAKYRIPFPDLQVAPNPCTNGFGPTGFWGAPRKPVPGIIVDCLHKSSLQVLLASELPWAGGRKP